MSDHEIDLRDFFQFIYINKKFIILSTLIFSFTSVIYSLTLPNIYTVETLLRPTNSDSNLMSQYGGIASLAGINFQDNKGDDVSLAIAMVNSKKILSNLIKRQSFLQDLIAAEAWDMSTNKIIYNENIYNSKKNQWVRKTSPPFNKIPSVQEASPFFAELISVSQDKKNNLVTLRVDHVSPVVAQKWSIWITQEVNTIIANMKVNESQASIDYLNDLIKNTPFAELRSMFYELIQETTKSMMLAKVNPEYVLTTIDPPLIPEIKSKPNRLLICIFGGLFGMFLSIVILFVRLLGWGIDSELDPFKWIKNKS